MKLIWILLFALLTVVALKSDTVLAEEPIDKKLTPFVISAGSKLDTYQTSMVISILSEVLKKHGYQLKAISTPSPRSLILANTGQVDGDLHRVHNFHQLTSNKFPNLYRINSHMITVYRAAFALDKKVKIRSINDLGKYYVIYQRGRKDLETLLPKYVPKDQLYPTTYDINAFKMLHKGRGDVVISELERGKFLLKSTPDLKGIRVAAVLNEIKIYTYLHIKHKKLADGIAATLDEMKKDGSYQKLLQRFQQTFQEELRLFPQNTQKWPMD